MTIYKVSVEGTKFIFEDGPSALTFAIDAFNHMENDDRRYSWSGKVSIEIIDEPGKPEGEV